MNMILSLLVVRLANLRFAYCNFIFNILNSLTGGTAACVIAGRLQRADPSLSVLMIEEGRNNYQDPTVLTPGLFLSHMTPDSTSAVFIPARESEQIGGRQIIVPRAAILGGGSSINFMMYARAQAVDFDHWETEGWSNKEMLPLLKKLETYHVGTQTVNMDTHGTSAIVLICRIFSVTLSNIAGIQGLTGL